MISDRTYTVVIGVVTTVWAINILAGITQFNDYHPPESINGVFMGIVGTAFLARNKSSSKDDDR